MAQSGVLKRTVGPIALTNTLTTNVYNNSSALIYDVIKMLHVVNKTGSAATFSLWLGATGANAAGTELFSLQNVPAQSVFQYVWVPGMKMLSTDFLVGGASANTTLTLTLFGEQLVV
jgi:hypothetical protein